MAAVLPAAGIAAGGGLGTALTIGGTLFSALGKFQEARAQSAAQKSAAQAAAFNAQVARNNAIQAQRAAETEAADIRRETARRISSIQSGFAKGGVTLEGSPLLAVKEQAQEGELEAQRRLQQGELQAQAQQTQAILDKQEAEQKAASAQRTLTGGILGSTSTLLSGTSSLLRKK